MRGVLQLMRQSGVICPIFCLAHSQEPEVRIETLDCGADDCISVPAYMREILARVAVLLRRGRNLSFNIPEYRGLSLDHSKLRLRYFSADQGLTKKEFGLMELLLHNPCQVFTSSQLIDAVWGSGSEIGTNVLWTNISYLRTKLLLLQCPVTIRSVRGVGYALE